jgi:hypothetical protein
VWHDAILFLCAALSTQFKLFSAKRSATCRNRSGASPNEAAGVLAMAVFEGSQRFERSKRSKREFEKFEKKVRKESLTIRFSFA